jgi:hypothetical protein
VGKGGNADSAFVALAKLQAQFFLVDFIWLNMINNSIVNAFGGLACYAQVLLMGST